MQALPTLDPAEARVLGVLVEKELTTPEQYPLSLNALIAGCNQRSNRDPVRAMSQGEVLSALERLRLQQLAGLVQQAGGRVERWRHNARETLALDPAGLALVAELLLRGPQQPGELRTRASRMHPFEALEALEQSLEALGARGLVKRLAPAAGARAPRWAQRLAPEAHPESASSGAAVAAADPEVALLRARVAELEVELARSREEIRRILGGA